MYYINRARVGIPDEKDLKWPCIEHGDRTQDICYPVSPIPFSTGFSTSMTKLTTAQCSDLIERYVELITDSMDWKTMTAFVVNTLTEDYHNLSEEELLNDIECSFDTETLNELVDGVTTVTYGLDEGESLSFPVHGT